MRALGACVLASAISRFTHPTKCPPKPRKQKKPAARKTVGFSSRRRRLRDGGELLLISLPCGASGMAAIGAADGAMRERGRLRLDKLMP
ncbi:hypothetical protein [Achromobacter denitrificans]|uniref:hypothetical protein n=1 Tax=Achromobacter denitrificans TaxID=32002 RepID=UPI001E2FB4B4|nr:hypothetical protein [Achromobacter denitrificans]